MTIDEAIAKFENAVLYESLGILPKHEENQLALDALREKKERTTQQARAGKSENMKTYSVKVTCEYYVEVEAESKDEALAKAIDADYELCDLQNFDYTID